MNPFRETIVANPWETTRVDVPAIHGQVFEQCLAGVDFVRDRKRSAALLIHGEAGSGKTHLLSRLRERLTPTRPPDTTRPEYLYVWVRLQTSPRMIWRTLRRTLVDDWFRPAAGRNSQFERILFHRLAEIRPAEGDLERWYEYMLDEHPDGLAELMDEIATNLDLDRNTAVAFMHIAFGRHLRDLRAWLAGTSLPQAALARLDLAQDDGTDEEREDQSRQIVLMLCQLAGDGLPIVLSFDQVEALQTTPGDHDALFAFGQLVSTLHDGTTNVLLVSCVQSAFATELKDHARRADYDRMTSLGALSLDPLSVSQAEQLIAARLTTADSSLLADRSDSTCWPLSRQEFTDLFAAGVVSPRKLLSLCAERIDAPAVPETAPASAPAGPRVPGKPKVATFLQDQWDAALDRKLAGSTPESTEEIVRHGLPLVVKMLSPDLSLTTDDQLADVPLLFEPMSEPGKKLGSAGKSGPGAKSKRIGVSICTQSNMNSFTAQLKRLKKQFVPERLQRLVILRDARVPLSEGAKVARQQLAELEQKHAVVIYPPVEVLAALDALRELLSDAKSGDLACQGETVAPQTVEEWLVAQLPAALREFVQQVLTPVDDGEAPSDTPDIDALNALLEKNPMQLLEAAAEMLQRPVDQIVATARRHPDQFRIIGEPPEMLFRAIQTTETPT